MFNIDIYTDGACSGNPGEAGYGVILIDTANGNSKEISQSIGNSTNNIAELSAIKAALLACKRAESTNAVVYTDSKYAIGVCSGTYKAKKNTGLITAIQETMATFKSIEFKHVRGHEGNVLNERADSLAKAAIE